MKYGKMNVVWEIIDTLYDDNDDCYEEVIAVYSNPKKAVKFALNHKHWPNVSMALYRDEDMVNVIK